MANYSPGTTGSSSTTTITAGIHSSNKTHEKPAIAARPIPPPTLPKYSSSFNKADRDRNEFVGKIDRTDRDKVWCYSFCSVHLSPLDVYIVVCCQLVFFFDFLFHFYIQKTFLFKKNIFFIKCIRFLITHSFSFKCCSVVTFSTFDGNIRKI
jgi:hypothetical protein